MYPLGGLRVAHRVRAVHHVDEALQQQAGDHQVGQAGHQDPADRVGRAPADPAVEQCRGPAVQAAQAAPDQQEEAEDQRGDEGRGDDERDVVLRHPHQLADLVLPVLPEPEGDHDQDGRGDEEDEPGPAPRAPGVPVGEGTPDPRGEHAEPVADGRGDAPDQALDYTAAGEQRRREGKAPGNERSPAARERDIKQLPGFPGLRRRLRTCRRHYRRGALDGPGRLTGTDQISTLALHIGTPIRRRTDRRPRHVTRHGYSSITMARRLSGIGTYVTIGQGWYEQQPPRDGASAGGNVLSTRWLTARPVLRRDCPP